MHKALFAGQTEIQSANKSDVQSRHLRWCSFAIGKVQEGWRQAIFLKERKSDAVIMASNPNKHLAFDGISVDCQLDFLCHMTCKSQVVQFVHDIINNKLLTFVLIAKSE